MAGLLLIFIFVTVLKDVQLQQQVAKPAKFLREWQQALHELCTDRELRRKELAPDCQTGTIELPNKVFFGFNETDLTSNGREALKDAIPIILDKLQAKDQLWKRLEIEVRGHADPRVDGTRNAYEINLQKSEKRAEAVLLFLTETGALVPKHRKALRAKAVASGASHSRRPEACENENMSEDMCHQKMRRVEILLRLEDREIQQKLIELLDQILPREQRSTTNAGLG